MNIYYLGPNLTQTMQKVRVSETPGKTKHFQTLPLTEDITLCDCPGLVMPSIANSKAGMVLQVNLKFVILGT